MNTGIIAAAVLLAAAAAPVFAADNVPPVLKGAKAALAARSLSLASMLAYALEDERMARAEYAAVLDSFGQRKPYMNVIRAEESHIRSLEALFPAHGTALPVDAAGEPTPPKDWTTAIEEARQAEIDNIAMYDRFLTQGLPADVRAVFTELKAGSQNHLRAFTTGGRT